ncbi:MAG: Uma2 family endonuclease [Anaerolineaceae bacterium]
MPEEPPYSEYVYGEVVWKIAPQKKHVSLVDELSHFLGSYRRRVGGFSGAEQRVKFETERGLEYRLPDYAYWAPAKPQGPEETLLPPTLAVEVWSPDETMDSQRAKCRYYRRYGVDIAWLIDPQSRTVEVFEGEPDGVVLAADRSLQSVSLPGFALALVELFGALD